MRASRWRRAVAWCWHYIVRIRTRLLIINLVLVLVPVIGIEWARTYEREALWALERDMKNQAQVLRTILEKNVDSQKRPRVEIAKKALETIARRTRMRIRLLDPSGNVVADSHRKGAPEGPEPSVSRWLGTSPPPRRLHDPKKPSTNPGPLSGRKEVKAAGKGELGTATRIHHRIQRVFLFLALPVMIERRVKGIVYATRSTTPVLISLHRLRRRLIQVQTIALGLTFLITLFLATTISRPLTQLTRKAERIAKGDRSQSLHLRRSDEIGQLARSFDSLVKQLADRARYISEFAANISHEFKTPLTSIRGAAELLEEGAADDPTARQRFLGNIQKDVGRLDRLVSRILQLSRIEATLEQSEKLDLAEVAASVRDSLAEAAKAKVVFELPERPLPIKGQSDHLQSALHALIENAIRYSPEGTPVRVLVGGDGGGPCWVRVVDRGTGISAANQSKIFERFFTTESARGGTGLGLAIVDLVVRASGGKVHFSSEPGKGCTFELRFPTYSAGG